MDRADELNQILAGFMAELDAGDASVERLEQILMAVNRIKGELPEPAMAAVQGAAH